MNNKELQAETEAQQSKNAELITSAPLVANTLLAEVENYHISPTVEFTEDGWNTVYTGSIYQSSIYSHLIESNKYGRFWIPKCYVREVR